MAPMVLPDEEWDIKRGKVKISIPGRMIAAPMAGVLDPPYRTLVHEMGCPMSFTEMISSKGMIKGSDRTDEIANWRPASGISGAQIFGSDEDVLARAASMCVEMGHDLVDLNAGCPKRKVMAQGSGGALLKKPQKLAACLKAMVGYVDVPVGVKIRSGVEDPSPHHFKEIMENISSSGISYVSIHPRSVSQGYMGKADVDLIDLAMEMLDVPLIASGDIWGPDDVSDRLGRGASAVMAARTLMGAPEWFPKCRATLINGETWHSFPSDHSEVHDHMDLLRRHFELSLEHYGRTRAPVVFRSHLGWYLKGFRGRKGYMNEVHTLSTPKDVLSMIDRLESAWKCQIEGWNHLTFNTALGH